MVFRRTIGSEARICRGPPIPVLSFARQIDACGEILGNRIRLNILIHSKKICRIVFFLKVK